jgi:hypothetical protein
MLSKNQNSYTYFFQTTTQLLISLLKLQIVLMPPLNYQKMSIPPLKPTKKKKKNPKFFSVRQKCPYKKKKKTKTKTKTKKKTYKLKLRKKNTKK